MCVLFTVFAFFLILEKEGGRRLVRCDEGGGEGEGEREGKGEVEEETEAEREESR